MPDSTRPSGARRTLVPLVSLGVAGFLALVLMEGALRSLDLLGISYYEEAKRYHLEKIADEDLIYAHRPNHVTRYQSVDVSFNEHGFRDDPIGPREPDELRILFLGDSVTFGWGVEQDAIFPARLEQILTERLGRPVDVINTGVGSYNTVQQRAVLERFGESLEADLVLLLYVYNDIGEHARPFDPHAQFDLSQYNLSGKIVVTLGRSWLYRLVQHIRHTRGGDEKSGAAPRSAGWLASLEALDDIAAWSRAHDRPFATYVWRRSAHDGDRLWSDLVEAGAEADFPVVEASPAWVEVEPHRLSAVDSHPNAEGHNLLARALARDLEDRGWLPPAKAKVDRNPPVR